MKKTISNKFKVEDYEIKLKRSLECDIERDSIEDRWIYDNDDLFIYLSGLSIDEIIYKIKEEILYSILYYMNEKDDTKLSNSGYKLKCNLSDIVVYCRKANTELSNVLLIPFSKKDDVIKSLHSYFLKSGKFNPLKSKLCIKDVQTLDKSGIINYCQELMEIISKNKSKYVIVNIPYFYNGLNYDKIKFVLDNVCSLYHLCIVTEDFEYTQNYNDTLKDIKYLNRIINIEDLICYKMNSNFEELIALMQEA